MLEKDLETVTDDNACSFKVAKLTLSQKAIIS